MADYCSTTLGAALCVQQPSIQNEAQSTVLLLCQEDPHVGIPDRSELAHAGMDQVDDELSVDLRPTGQARVGVGMHF